MDGWMVPGPEPETDGQTTLYWTVEQWLQTAREPEQDGCRSATSSVSQADLANGLANWSGRAMYLSETRSDVKLSGARSRLRGFG